VEPSPEVIAHLATAVAQLKRGLVALEALDTKSPSLVLLAEVEDVLRTALRVAARQVNDEALTPADLSALASLPARLARIEGRENGRPRAAVPLSVDVLTDAAGGRVLVSATGKIEPALVLAREPGTGRLLLTVGAHVAHHERVGVAVARAALPGAVAADAAEDKAFPPRGAYTSAFRMVPQPPAR